MMTLLYCASIISLVLLILGLVLSKKNESDRELQSPFECGCSTLGESRMQFSLHFYLVALVFIIFDVELIILFPFFTYYSSFPYLVYTLYFSMILLLLTLGLLSEWNQMVLEWAK